MSKPIYTVTFELTESDLQNIINVLNDYEFDGSVEDEDEDPDLTKPLTIEEVKENPELLKYLCEMDYKDYAFSDLFGYWNNDGWTDVRKYRK